MSKQIIRPDYGVFFKETFGSDPVCIFPDFKIDNISYVNNNLYTTSTIVIYDNTEYYVSIDFNRENLNQLLLMIDDVNLKGNLRVRFFKEFESPIKMEFPDTPIELSIDTRLGDTITNQNETYIPFIVNDFFGYIPSSFKRSLLNLIPNGITHVMVNENKPVGFAVESESDDIDDIDDTDENDETNIINAYVCYPEMAHCCEWGAVYLFSNLEEAKKSFAWKASGGFNFAIPMDSLNEFQLKAANLLWFSYEDSFREGFKSNEVNID